MAVKVVSTEPDPSVVKYAVCRNCGVRLEYLPMDVKEHHGTDIGGGPDGHEWIDCPQCSKQVILRSW
jgi:DNA-directed RNA polymerase subunit RPC12/RpoP